MDNELRPLIESIIKDVEKAYPGLRMSNRWEWNHKVAYIGYLRNKRIFQKRAGSGPVSEDTIGITNESINGVGGQEINATFEAVDLVSGSTGAIQWLSYGLVNQTLVVPTVADISLIGNTPTPTPVPVPPPIPIPFPSYNSLGDDQVFGNVLGKTLESDYHEAGRLPDGGFVIWASRTLYDAFYWIIVDKMEAKAAVLKSIDKHRKEWRHELGLQ